ncbi:MAG: delta-60 repeat domain-containing protein [Verrucomicrobiales bacterium]|nr:delta-60 repeat domain-containing protein [Verrucomicrobiales bacterium]MCP5558216.1 delta-60 repeat domain-containing protein [Verrucomicrobiaceae bacterium]
MRNHIARLNADGTLDTGFDPNADATVLSLALQADGKVLLGGNFNTLQPNGAAIATARNYIARVNGDGTLDTDFDPNGNGSVFTLAVQDDGKILLGGNLTSLQPNGAASPTVRNRIARVNMDGTVDVDFDPNPNGTVSAVVVQPDGKILVGGSFVFLQPNGAASATLRFRIARLEADGAVDQEFDPKASNGVLSLALQADGNILLAGSFITLQPNGAVSSTTRNRIARVDASGNLDMNFDPNANGRVDTVALQADGKILLGGEFTNIQPNGAASATVRSLFARLVNDPATNTLSAIDPTRVNWVRGGGAPELSMVTIEHSVDGGITWSLPLAASRVGTTSNWEVTGLSLPPSGQIRARGRAISGFFNGSSGLIEQVAGFGPDADNDGLINAWEELYWPGMTALHGALDDDDHDGLVNLLELAFGLDPMVSDTTGMPPVIEDGGYLTMTIVKRAGVIYEVQSAGSLLATDFSGGTTVVLLDDAGTLKVRDTVPLSTPTSRFMRVKVTGNP